VNATEALYRSSLLLEGRYDELTEMTGLRAELAIALTRLARDPTDNQAGAAPQGAEPQGAEPQAPAALFRRAVTVIDDGRVRMLSDLMERDRDQLSHLEARRSDLYRAYLAAAERLRGYEAEQWQVFQRL
jgi:hypothetical protein